jgi:hypothetical protein
VWLLVETLAVSIHGAKILLKVMPQASHDHILWNELAPIQRSGHIRTDEPHLEESAKYIGKSRENPLIRAVQVAIKSFD